MTENPVAMPAPTLYLCNARPLARIATSAPCALPAHHLVTHGVVVGMTGSGKTGLVTVLVEEALRAGMPVLAIDVKGDLPNLLFAFPSFDAGAVRPYVDAAMAATEDRSPDALAEEIARARRDGLSSWGIGDAELRAFHEKTSIRVLTPGSSRARAGFLIMRARTRSRRR